MRLRNAARCYAHHDTRGVATLTMTPVASGARLQRRNRRGRQRDAFAVDVDCRRRRACVVAKENTKTLATKRLECIQLRQTYPLAATFRKGVVRRMGSRYWHWERWVSSSATSRPAHSTLFANAFSVRAHRARHLRTSWRLHLYFFGLSSASFASSIRHFCQP